MRRRIRSSALTSLALLSTATISSSSSSSSPLSNNPLLAFTTPANNRIRRKLLARTILQASSSSSNDDNQLSEFTRYTAAATTKKEQSSSKTNNDVSTNNGIANPSSTLSMMVDQQREFEINLGRAMDTLKNDYPKLLTNDPSWNIYHTDLEVIDPTGVSLHGLSNYKRAFSFIHAVVYMFYCEEKSGLTFRSTYDWARKAIRISWNVELVPKMIMGGTRNTLHVDGISEYYLDRTSGLVTEHKVSHLLINDQAVRPENGVFHALAEMSPVNPDGVPVFYGLEENNQQKVTWEDMTHVNFQTWNPLTNLISGKSSSSSLFNNPNEQAMQLPENNNNAINTDSQVPYDRDALQRKNDSRKKFGLPPITPDEFIKIEEEVRAMDAVNKKKATYLAEQLASSRKKEEKDSFLNSIFGGVLKNGCESNFDCERPEVCCDVGFKKICCSNGLGIVDGIPLEKWERAKLRVPMENDDYGGNY
eukprot:CAMPEP_0201739516 /NCGR_PEP_ID=MMETSP0593-20130828/45821_1 /ASSEMBLY_ACC=CAM_ASM_000672 /TAXON_ID=267983 /ORGANISM="Skeletonema japonicum, Strain CCMP2506" /LENGTH=475 /DNA_ID=CAMNT_0048233789 /DNA_START=560 /DNA_END=1987 /DNA_ORIENTATION=+